MACASGWSSRANTTTTRWRATGSAGWPKRRAPGNLTLDTEADWVDWSAAGLTDGRTPTDAMIDLLATVDLSEELYQFGLRGTIDPKARSDIAGAILQARAALQRAHQGSRARARWSSCSTPRATTTTPRSRENLLFGTPVSPAFDVDRLAENDYVLSVLDKAGLTDDLVKIGREVAETMTEIFADLPPGHEFFEQFSFISSEDLPEFQALLGRVDGRAPISPADRARLLTLPFKLIEARHRLGLLDDAIKARVLEARRAFREGLPQWAQGAIEFFDPAAYNAATTLQDNILFGKLAYGQARAAQRVGKLIVEVLEELKLRRAVLEVGLEYPVGVGGARLSQAPAPEAGNRARLAEAARHPDPQRGDLDARHGIAGAHHGRRAEGIRAMHRDLVAAQPGAAQSASSGCWCSRKGASRNPEASKSWNGPARCMPSWSPPPRKTGKSREAACRSRKKSRSSRPSRSSRSWSRRNSSCSRSRASASLSRPAMRCSSRAIPATPRIS